ncbi:MAG: VOC family protein [Blastochloris sp.]|nr:VOC family protein [Blastochloris sp.]
MFNVSKYPHGTFCWADCTSTDQQSGKQFYSQVMGWTTEDLPLGGGMVYTNFRHEDKVVAAIAPNAPGTQNPHSVWNCYVNVENIEALADKVKALGGTIVMQPLTIFEQGRMMIIQDPTGAFLGLWEAKQHIGSQLVNTPGSMTWNELATRDPQRAESFFSQLFGWTFQTGPMDGYKNIFNQGRINGGMITMDDAWEGLPPHWMVYFSVANIEETAAKAEALGGKLGTPISDAPNTGRFAVISDPQGAHFTAIQLMNPMPWNE